MASTIISDSVLSSLVHATSFVNNGSCGTSGIPSKNPSLIGLYPVTSLLTGNPKGLTIKFTIPATGLSYTGNKPILRVLAVVSSSAANTSFGYAYKDFDAVAGSYRDWETNQ